MKCPLFVMAVLANPNLQGTMASDCLKEECAWWEQDLNLCAVKELALELRYTQLRLADILAKMPHELQFRKV